MKVNFIFSDKHCQLFSLRRQVYFVLLSRKYLSNIQVWITIVFCHLFFQVKIVFYGKNRWAFKKKSTSSRHLEEEDSFAKEREKRQWGRQCWCFPAKETRNTPVIEQSWVCYLLQQGRTHTMRNHEYLNKGYLNDYYKSWACVRWFGGEQSRVWVWIKCCLEEKIILWLNFWINTWRRRGD